MPKAMPLQRPEGQHGGWMIFCPACQCGHLFDERWTFNGDVEKPTFSPSMLVNATLHATHPHMPRCHSFVNNGRIQFLTDCSHDMKGQTVDLPEVD